jgi:histidinol-phosphatase
VAGYLTELDFAREAAALGGRIAMQHFGRDPQTNQKRDGTYVTEADRAAEAQIRLRVAGMWPDYNIHGEEEGLTAAGGGPAVASAPTWVIDPIDGTNNFIAGIPIWATLVALRVDGVSVVGVAHAPALGETYEAALGSGARMNGESIRVAEVNDLGEATLVSTGLEQFIDGGLAGFYGDVVSSCRRSRGFGDFWGHVLVARGAAHIAMEPEMFLWDFSALEPIVTEAGGRISQFSGDPCAHGASCLTTNSLLHEEVLRRARK